MYVAHVHNVVRFATRQQLFEDRKVRSVQEWRRVDEQRESGVAGKEVLVRKIQVFDAFAVVVVVVCEVERDGVRSDRFVLFGTWLREGGWMREGRAKVQFSHHDQRDLSWWRVFGFARVEV